VRGHVVVDRVPREGIRRDELARGIDDDVEPRLLERLAARGFGRRLVRLDAAAGRIEGLDAACRIAEADDEEMTVCLADGRRADSFLRQVARQVTWRDNRSRC
jgi:hypothetical protein